MLSLPWYEFISYALPSQLCCSGLAPVFIHFLFQKHNPIDLTLLVSFLSRSAPVDWNLLISLNVCCAWNYGHFVLYFLAEPDFTDKHMFHSISILTHNDNHYLTHLTLLQHYSFGGRAKTECMLVSVNRFRGT